MTQQAKRPLRYLPWVLVLLLVPSLALAGGVVEELRTSPDAMKAGVAQIEHNSQEGRHSTTDGVKEAPPFTTAIPVCTKQNKRGPKTVSLFYDPIQKQTLIRWKALIHEGQDALQYHIYRWSLKDQTRRLIAKLDGKILEFVDTNKTTIGEVYFYDIVGIYNIDGHYQSWQYPSQRLTPQQNEKADPPPQPGVGCSTLQQRQSPGDGWLWLLVLPLLAFFRQGHHTRNP